MPDLTVIHNDLPELTVADVAALSPQQLQQFDLTLTDLLAWIKQARAKLDAALVARYGEAAQAALLASGRDFGVTHVADGDLRITYETTSKDVVESNPVRVGVGMGSWGGSFGGSVNVGSPSVRNYREGTLVIHAIDNARNAEVWQGRVSGKITKGSTEPAAVATAVQAAMKDFPARGAGSP